MADRSPALCIGTSGWHYRHWRGLFYPKDLASDRWFDYYQQHLASVEINNSFYRLLNRDTVRAWVKRVPREFVFAVKGSRFITHNKKLKDPRIPLQRFFEPVRAFGRHLGPIVFQLPPRWSLNIERLEAFLRALPRGHRYAFELRNPDWWCEEVYAALRRHRAAFCIYELAGVRTPYIVTTDFVYVRLHGPGKKKYQGDYSAARLKTWAKRIAAWRDTGHAVYVYFDNDQAAYAAANALRLARYCGLKPAP